jgi:hypothetical protein
MEQTFNQSLDIEHSRFDHEKGTVNHPKYYVFCSVRLFFRN